MHQRYILYSASSDRYYVGSTSVGVEIRLARHNDGWSRSTKSGIPWKLVFVQSYPTKKEAQEGERNIKKQKSRGYIEELIESDLNEWRSSR